MFIAVLTVDIISFKDEGGVGETLGALVTCEVLWMEDLTKGTGKWTTKRRERDGEGRERDGEERGKC